MTKNSLRLWMVTLPMLGLLLVSCMEEGDIEDQESRALAGGSAARPNGSDSSGGADYLNCNCSRSVDGSFTCQCGSKTVVYQPSNTEPAGSIGPSTSSGGTNGSSSITTTTQTKTNSNTELGGSGPLATSNFGGAIALSGGTRSYGGSSNQVVATGGNGSSGATATGGTRSNVCTNTPRASESCENAVAWGFCGQAWYAGNCDAACGLCSMGTGGASGGSRNVGGATGGSSSTGGNRNTGGTTGGSSSTGGNRNTGGTTHTGGLTATGGTTTATGGVHNSGGSGSISTGGTTPTGGALNAGGTMGTTGGIFSVGGMSSSGGAK